VVALGAALLVGIVLVSTIFVAMANELSYPGMVLEFLLDCLFLAALMLFFLACFKFFMDLRGGRSGAHGEPCC
jgi:hypothetical protein